MIERKLLPWSLPLLPQAARFLVEHYAPETREAVRGAEARMAGVVVVLPGSRAGRRLKELLVEAAREAGVRLVPPRIVTQGILPDLLHEPGRPMASGPARRLVWAEALRTAASGPERAALAEIFAALPAGPEGRGPARSLSEWTPLARELQRLARSVAAGGYRFREVAERCAASPLYDDGPRWRVLARIQDRVEARLASLGFGDRDLARMQALDEGAVRLPGDVWLVGVAELPGVVRRMLTEARGGTLRALVHAPDEPGAEVLFDDLGCIRPDPWSTYHLPLPDHRVRMVDRPVDQADAVARLLLELDGAYAPDDIVIGVPGREVVPALEQRLPRSGVAVRAAEGVALAASGPFRLLRAVAEVLAERRYEALAALVRHPDVAPALRTAPGEHPFPEDWITALDAWQSRHLPGDLSRGLPGARSREGEAAAGVVERVDALLAPLAADRRPLSRWVEPVLRFLAGIYRSHGLSQERERDRLVLRALEELRWSAETLARIPEPLDLPCDAADAIRFLLEEAAAVRLPAPAREEAVEMLGWLELHLDDAPVTVITGVNEGSLPESVRGDVFLPDALRRLLGLEDNRQRFARDVYRLAAVLRSREVVHLVAGRRTGEGDPLRPSRLLFAADDETVVRRVRSFYGESGGDDDDEARAAGVEVAGPGAGGAGRGAAPGREGPGVSDVPGAPGFRLPPEDAIALDPFPRTLRVTDFARILADPYEWALGRIRGVDILSDEALEMDGALFGTLAHEVLQGFGKEEVERHAEGTVLTDPVAVWERLEPFLDRRVAARFGPRGFGSRVAVRLQVEQLRSRLRRFAEWHAGWVAQGWRVRAVEIGPPGGEGIPFPYGDGVPPVALTARIDRVDHNPARGEWAVFDYKTSDGGDPPDTTHRKKSTGEWTDLQLPLYHWLVTRLPGPDGRPLIPESRPVVRVGYIRLPRDLDSVGDAMAEWDEETLADGVERARERLRMLAAGPVRFEPEARPRYPEDQMEALVGRSVLAGVDDTEEDE